MICKFCELECNCHVVQPCGLCETHTYCEGCGLLVCQDKVKEIVQEFKGEKIHIYFCPDCYEMKSE